ESYFLRTRHMLLNNFFKDDVGPFALGAAIVQAVRMAVLPAGQGIEQGIRAVLFGIAVHGLLSCRDVGRGPVVVKQLVVQLSIAGIGGVGRVIDKVAIQVDVVFSRAA